MSTAIAALRFSPPSRRPLRAISLACLACLLMAGLSACGGKDQNQTLPDAVDDRTATGQSGMPGQDRQDTSTPSSAPAPSAKPRVETPPSFTPTADEVRTAMQQILVQKAMTMPPSPQRDQWYAAESARFAAVKVGNCTTAPLGTPSVCHIAVGEKTTQVKVLLTRAGWILVK